MSILVLESSLWGRAVVMVEWLFLAVPWGCLRYVIVVFPDHTHLLFLITDHSKAVLLLWIPLLCSLVCTWWPCESATLFVLLCVTFSCVIVTFPYGIPGQVWYLIVSIPDLKSSLLLYYTRNSATFPGRMKRLHLRKRTLY